MTGWPPKATFYDTPFEKQRSEEGRVSRRSPRGTSSRGWSWASSARASGQQQPLSTIQGKAQPSCRLFQLDALLRACDPKTYK